MKHGTQDAYRTHKCRCADCRAFNAARCLAQKQRRSGGLPAGDARHGTVGGYTNWSCRCVLCVAAMTAHSAGRVTVRRVRLVKRKYGLTQEEWDARFESQGSGCASCGTSEPGTVHGWATDHDHVTGLVREILCHGCNVSLGQLAEDPERIEALARYARKWALIQKEVLS